MAPDQHSRQRRRTVRRWASEATADFLEASTCRFTTLGPGKRKVGTPDNETPVRDGSLVSGIPTPLKKQINCGHDSQYMEI